MSARTTRLKFQALGLVMVLLFAGFFTFTVAMYEKVFTPAVMVTAKVARVGSQLQSGATVKARGVEVGEVSSVQANGSGAKLELRLYPELAEQLPKAVSAALLPKTLFGDRYVSLKIPDGSDTRSLRDGDVIKQDRSSSTVAIQDVLDDLIPVLHAVPPAKLATTLSSISTALQGKGEQLGRTLVRLGDYLGKMNPQLPKLTKDLQRFVQVTPDFNKAAPKLIDAMSNFSTTARTLSSQHANLERLYGSVVGTSRDLQRFLMVNRKNLITLAGSAKPTLQMLERYAPEYPCLFQQFADQVDSENRVFGKGTDRPKQAHLVIGFAAGRGQYKPGTDDPKNLDDRGPRCYKDKGAPWRFPQYPNNKPLKDGTSHPPPPKKTSADDSDTSGTIPQAAAGHRSVANSKPEQRLISTLLAPQLKESPKHVPDWASMLVGPLYRGSVVELR